MKSAYIAAVMGIGLSFTFIASAVEAANLVTNGGFESTTNGAGELGGGGQTTTTTATDWTSNGYNFLFTPGSADTTGAPQSSTFSLTLWGPNNGSANGLPATSPGGGNFVAMDGNYSVGALTQTINGLVAGTTYALTFDWGLAQQQYYTDPNSGHLQVSLGSQTGSTPSVSIGSEGFSGWLPAVLTFTATSSSELLSFLAASPAGAPPFLLLDDVALNATVSEPASIALLGAAVLGLGLVSRRRRPRHSATV